MALVISGGGLHALHPYTGTRNSKETTGFSDIKISNNHTVGEVVTNISREKQK